MSEQFAIAGTLLVVGGSLAGVWFGWRLGRAERDQQWRRDKQIDAYADFVGACADFALGVDRFQTLGTDEALNDLKPTVVRFHNAWHRTLIVAPSTVRWVVDLIVGGVHAIGTEMDKEALDTTAISEQLQALAVARQRLSEEASKSLGFGTKKQRFLSLRRSRRGSASGEGERSSLDIEKPLEGQF